MAASSTDIANLALIELGVTQIVVDLATERTAHAAALRVVYDQAIDEVLAAYDWPFARRRATLALVETDPNDEWGYSYRYPSDAVGEGFRGFWNGDARRPARALTVRYHIGGDDTGRLLFTDEPDAVGWYTSRVTSPAQWSPLFTAAVALNLAAKAAFAVAGERAEAMRQRAEVLYERALNRAMLAATREEAPDDAPDGDLVRARA